MTHDPSSAVIIVGLVALIAIPIIAWLVAQP